MRYLVVIFFLTSIKTLCSQEILIRFNQNDSITSNSLPDSILVKKENVEKKIKFFQNKIIAEGHLLFSYDSILRKEAEITCFVTINTKFNKVILKISKQNKSEIIKKLHLRKKELDRLSFIPSEITKLMNNIRDSYLDTGFPFVEVKFENPEIDKENNLKAKLEIIPGNRYKWSKLHIKGDSTLSVKFLSELLNIKKGKLYNESTLKKVQKEIEQLIFVKEIKNHEVLFTPEGVEVFLYLTSKKSSSVDGMVGLQPNISTNTYRLAGELRLKLSNTLKRGEYFELYWKGLKPETQSLFLFANAPFLFNTSFGLGGKTLLYKQDSSFIEIKSSANVQYFIGKGFYLKGIYNFYNNRSLINDISSNQEYLNIRSHSYGLSLFKQKLDYIPNPSKGIVFSTELSFGKRKTSSYVDSVIIETPSLTSRTNFSFELYVPIANRHIAHLVFKGEQLYASGLFNNELVRFGGLNSLRGFNEEELFASANLTGLVEYRFLVDRNSNAFLFYNHAWYENNTALNYYNDFPYGFGVGYSFGSKLGVFSVVYALGKQQGDPIELKNGKLHVGYISYF